MQAALSSLEIASLNIKPGPDTKHSKLETEARDFLIELGYYVGELTYHSVLPREIVKLLGRLNDPTSLCIRTRADRIAVNPDDVFYWEAKTHDGSKWHNMSLEAIPLIHHVKDAQLGVRCLYIYRDEIKSIEVGFWVEDRPPILKAVIPNRWTEIETEYFREQIQRYLNPRIWRIDVRVAGTGDPFIVIDEDYLKNMSHWKDLIIQSLRDEGK